MIKDTKDFNVLSDEVISDVVGGKLSPNKKVALLVTGAIVGGICLIALTAVITLLIKGAFKKMGDDLPKDPGATMYRDKNGQVVFFVNPPLLTSTKFNLNVDSSLEFNVVLERVSTRDGEKIKPVVQVIHQICDVRRAIVYNKDCASEEVALNECSRLKCEYQDHHTVNGSPIESMWPTN